MENALAGKVVALSGASSGVGLALAVRLLEAGCELCAIGRRMQPPAELSSSACRYIPLDLGANDATERLHDALTPLLDRIDVVINGAGHDDGGGVLFAQQEEAGLADTIGVNLLGAMRLTRACLPWMLARDRGDVVFLSSITTRRVAQGLATYSASKHGVHGFVDALRFDYRDSGVRFVEVVPGVVRTGFASRRWDGDDARAADFYAGFAQCLEADDVARCVVFALAQPAHVELSEIVIVPAREKR